MTGTLSREQLQAIDAYWRAANYLSVGQIYLYDNPLLKEPLSLNHIKPRLLGHWGTTPGLNFIYVHLNRLIREFEKEKWDYSLLTGQTVDRKSVINEFQNDHSKKIFLISLKAGGVGLNLTAADYVFITDPWWNPAAEMQAVSRAHRIGQDKKVFVYRFISENTVEEKIQKLQGRKLSLADEFISSNDPFRDWTKEEILYLFE